MKQLKLIRAAKPETRNCVHCGEEFTTTRRDKKFCSVKCCKEHYKQEHVKPKPLRKCPICDNEFTPNTNAQKYCSSLCCERAHGHPNVREHQCTCKRCGKKFVAAWNCAHCPKCAELIRQEKNAAQMKVDTATGKPVKTLAEWSREASERNLDYGTYRGLIEQCGRIYEELKATADNRAAKYHAHASKGSANACDCGYGRKVG